MGSYLTRDSTGALRNFTIKGDAPSPTETQRIADLLAGKPAVPANDVGSPDKIGLLGRVGRSALRGVDEAQAGVFSTLAGGAQAVGSPEYQKYFEDKAAEQLRQRDTVIMPEDTSFGQELATSAGSSVPLMAAGLAGAIPGAEAGAAIGSIAGPIGTGVGGAVGGAIGAAAATFPIMMGSNVQRQQQEHPNTPIDYQKAAVAAAGQAAIEGGTEALGLKVAGIIGRPLTPLLKKAIGEGETTGMKLLAKRLGHSVAVGIPAGAVEESTQQALERWQANLPMMDEQAQAEYLQSAIIGGILEGGFNAAAAGVGGVKDIKDRNALSQAKADADAERANITSNYDASTRADQRDLQSRLKSTTTGQIEDRTSGFLTEREPDQLNLNQKSPPKKNIFADENGYTKKIGDTPFTEEEYQAALKDMSQHGTFSPDRLKMTGMGRPKANTIFRAMKERGDAVAAGSAKQYLTIKDKPNRSFITAPIQDSEATPFHVTINGKQAGNNTFKTSEEATAWAHSAGINSFNVEQNKDSQRFGVYEMNHVGDQVVGKRLLKAFPSSSEANAAARELNPAFSEETNFKNKQLHEQVALDAQAKDAEATLGKTRQLMQDIADQVAGKGRIHINLVPKIDAAQLRALGVHPSVVAQAGGSLHEGVTTQPQALPDVKGMVKSVITLSTNLTNPNLTEEQRTKEVNSVLTHELVHAIRNLDILTTREWDGLTKYAVTQKVPGKKYTHLQWAAMRATPDGNPDSMTPAQRSSLVEEAIAEMLRNYHRDPTAYANPHRGMLAKIGNFLRKIMGLSKKYGAEDTMKAIFGGEMAGREVGSGGLGSRNEYPGNPAFSTVKVPGFYLKSDKFFSGLKQEKGSVEQWLGVLRNSGIKEEERNWLGLEQWMKDVAVSQKDAKAFIAGKQQSTVVDVEENYGYQNEVDYVTLAKQMGWQPTTDGKAQITRGEILDYIRSNAIDILHEKFSSDAPTAPVPALEDKLMAMEDDAAAQRNVLLRQFQSGGHSPLDYTSVNDYILQRSLEGNDEALKYKALQKEIANLKDVIFPPRPSHPFMKQAGSKQYSELLLHIPGLQPDFSVSTHFGGFKNIIASTRFTDRVFDGKKTLFIEEIQSDLHQRAKKSGYAQSGDQQKVLDLEDKLYEMQKQLEEHNADLENFDLVRRGYLHDAQNYEAKGDTERADEAKKLAKQRVEWSAETTQKRDALVAQMEPMYQEMQALHNRSQIPDAPFKTTWDELAFKRLVRYAVDNKFEQVAWHGEAQSVADTEKYGTLEERAGPDGTVEYWKPMPPEVQADDINVTGIVNFYLRRLRGYASKTFGKFATGPVFVPATGKGEEVSYHEIFPEFMDFNMGVNTMFETTKSGEIRRQLAKALQIARQQREFDPAAAIEKAGIPDKDFRELYAKTFPEYADVSRETHDAEGNPNYDKWVMPISQELKDAAIEGFPLFSSINVSDTPEFKKWFGNSKVVNDDGTPKRVYTGTSKDKDFNRFNAPKNGIWFTEDPESASQYAVENDSMSYARDLDSRDPWAMKPTNTASRVYPVYLSVQNPIDYSDGLPPEMMADNYKKAQGEHFAKLKANGIDGVKMPGGVWAVFSPNQIKSVFNRGTFDTDNPRIDFSSIQYSTTAPMGQRVPPQAPQDRLSEVEAKIKYNNLAPVLQKLSKVMGGNWKYWYEEKVEDGIINLQDRMQSWGKLIDRIKQNGGFISNENDPYLREQLFHGQTDFQLREAKKLLFDPLAHSVRDLKVTSADARDMANLSPSIKSLIDNYGDPKKGIAEVYVYAKHAVERNAEMRKRNENLKVERPEQFDKGSGLYDDEANLVMRWVSSKPALQRQLEKVSALVQKTVTSTNDVRVAGKLNPDFRLITKKDGSPADPYKFYVPLRSWIDEHLDDDSDVMEFARAGKGFNIRGKEDQSALGRKSLASNIIEHVILQNQEAIIRANKAKVGLAVLKLMRDVPDQMKDYAEIVATTKRKAIYDKKTGRVKLQNDNSVAKDPMVLAVKEYGQQIYIKFKDPKLARAMGTRTGLGNAGAGPILKAMLGFNRYLANINTSYNPEFLISNMLRDIEDALVNISEFDIKGTKKDIIKQVLPNAVTIYKALRSGDMSSPLAKDFEEFQRMGGMTAYMGIHEISDTIAKMNEHLQGDLSGAPQKVWKAIKSIGEVVEASNSAIENSTRLAVYRTMRDKFIAMGDRNNPAFVKRSQEAAARLAKNLTINFNMGGEMKAHMNALYLFYNAGIQGSMAVLNPLIRSKKMQKIWAGIFIMGMMQDLLQGIFGADDDDGKKVYDKIEDWKLEHNMILMDPFGLTDRGYFQIPLPYMLGAIYNFGRATSRGARGAYTPGQAATSALGVLAASMNPFGGANSFLNFLAPTVFDPIVDLALNTDYTGKNIAPPENAFSAAPEKASQRYWNNTSPTFKTIADVLSWATGSDGDYLPGAVEVSPNQVGYVFNYALGGAGAFANRIVDFVTKGPGEVTAADIPFARRVYGSVTTKNDTAEYFAHRDKVMPVLAELKAAAKAGDSEHYQEIMTKYPDEYRQAVSLNKIENARKKYSAKIKQIRETSKIPEDQKDAMIKALKAKQDELVGKANGLFN